MLGSKIKGLRHLLRVAKTPKEVLFMCNGRGMSWGYALTARYSGKDVLILANQLIAHELIDNLMGLGDAQEKMLKNFAEKSGIKTCTVINSDSIGMRRGYGMFGHGDYSELIGNIIVLDDAFIEKLNMFEAENKKMLTAFDDNFKNGGSYRYLFALTDGNKNIFLWAIRQLYKYGVSLYAIKNVIDWCNNYNSIASKLKKGSITSYNGHDGICLLLHELESLRKDARKNLIASTFNTKQKKVLKEKVFSDTDHEIFHKFSNLSGKKKVNFIKKMSTIEDASEILKQMSQLVDIHFSWNKESFMNYISNGNVNCEVALEKDNIVIVKVKDYDAVKRLAKTTNWCISKNKTYWNQYVECRSDAVQFVMFDFSRKEDSSLSIIGFTVADGFKITNAHDFQNKNLFSGCDPSHSVLELLNRFYPKDVNSKEIYSILSSHGISLSDLIGDVESRYEWNKDSFMEFFEHCVDEDSYIIVCDQKDKLAIITEGNGMCELFGNYYQSRIGKAYERFEHVIFADFNKPANNHEKLTFGICQINSDTGDIEIEHLYNDLCEALIQTFDSKLEEFGLPYDIVCRANDMYERFKKAMVTFDVNLADSLIKSKEVRRAISRNRNEDGRLFFNVVHQSLTGINTMDIVDMIYNNGLKMSDLFHDVAKMVQVIINYLGSLIGHGHVSCFIPTAAMIDDFYKKTIKNRNACIYIGLYLTLMKIIDHEDKETIYNAIAKSIFNVGVRGELFDYLLIDCAEILKGERIVSAIISYAKNNGRKDVVDAILHNSKSVNAF